MEKIGSSFSIEAKNYDCYAVIQAKVFKELKRRLKFLLSPYPLLDLGTGTGRGFKDKEGVFGVDLAFGMCKVAKSYIKVVNGKGEELPFKSKTFNVVFSSFSLQWMETEKTLREVQRVLKDEGYFLCAVPIEGSLDKLFTSWQRAYEETMGKKDKLFRFKSKEEILEAVANHFELLEVGIKEFSIKATSVKEAVKLVNKTGAKNPYRKPRPLKKTVKRFYELFSKNCVINYRVLFLTAVKKEERDGI